MKNWLILFTALFVISYSCNNEPKQTLGVSLNNSKVVILPNGDTATITGKDTTICSVITKYDTVIKKYVPVTGTRNNLIISSNFDGANPFAGWHYTQFCCSYSITQSTEQSRYPGGNSMRVELFNTDATVAGSKRAEINENTSEPLNSERWIGVSYYFPSATFAKDKDAELVLQFHTDASTGSPPFELDIVNGNFVFLQAVNPAGGATSNSSFFKNTVISPMIYDKWIDMVWHYKQSTAKDGLIEGWINGVKVYNQAGPNAFTGLKAYMKIGINKWTWMPGASWGGNQTHRLFYIDQLRFGNEKATFNDVDPSKP